MGKSQKRVPELRFKGFDQDWEQRKLKDVTIKIGSGKTPKGGKENYVTKGIPLLRSQNIYNEKVNFRDVVYINKEVDESMANSRVQKYDVLLNITGASIGRSAVYEKDLQANINQHVSIIRLNKNINPYFLQLNLTSDKGQNQIELNQAGGGREGLNFQQIAKMKFYFTSFEEEKKIEQLFRYLQNTIALLQQKLDKITELRKGYTQKMFPENGEIIPVLRFTNFNTHWEQRKLGEVLSIPEREKVTNMNDLKLMTLSLNNGGIKLSPNRETLSIGSTNYYKRNSGQLLYGKQNFFNGSMAIITEEADGYATSTDVPALDINVDKITTDYLIQYISRPNYYKHKEIHASGTGSKRIHEKTLFKFDMATPTLSEQAKIGNFFKQLDETITLHQKKIEKLKEIKRALLQKLFI